MKETAYSDQIRRLLESEQPANTLLALQIIEGIPSLKTELQPIEELDLSDLFLYEVPAMVFECENLISLTLSNNFLTEISPKIGQLKKLKSLVICNNQLSVLPKEMSRLRRLTYLNVAENNISYLPKQFTPVFILPFGLSSFDIGNNPIVDTDKVRCSRKAEQAYISLMAAHILSLDLLLPRYLKKRFYWHIVSRFLTVAFPIVTPFVGLVVGLDYAYGSYLGPDFLPASLLFVSGLPLGFIALVLNRFRLDCKGIWVDKDEW